MTSMTALDPADLPRERLASMLRAWARGLYPSEAAVEILIAHGAWLRRPDFLRELVDAVADAWGPAGSVTSMASIDWERVDEFLEHSYASSSEANLLRLAASLAGAAPSASLLELTRGLDDTNGALVLQALAHRFGWHERGTACVTTGHIIDPETSPMHGGAW